MILYIPVYQGVSTGETERERHGTLSIIFAASHGFQLFKNERHFKYLKNLWEWCRVSGRKLLSLPLLYLKVYIAFC